MIINRVWYPSDKGYKDHLDRIYIADNYLAAIKEQTNQFKSSILQQTNHLTDETKKLIASNDQIASALNDGFKKITEINERGFSRMTSAVEDLHGDLTYLLGTIIQKLEYQNSLLNGILSVMQEPYETKVKEYYRKGCDFIKQGFYEGAIRCFRKSIGLEMGEYFFPSHYQLGLLYLDGKDESSNVTDLQSATEFLLKANLLGSRLAKADRSFFPILADCKLFLSISFYRQLTGRKDSNEIDLLNNAIRYCKESVSFNPNLSQGFYHLAKYYAYKNECDKVGDYFQKALEFDRNYLRALIPDDIFYYDAVFEPCKKQLLTITYTLKDRKKIVAQRMLTATKSKIAELEQLGISDTIRSEYNNIKKQLGVAESDFNSQTYFGFDDCIINLNKI